MANAALKRWSASLWHLQWLFTCFAAAFALFLATRGSELPFYRSCFRGLVCQAHRRCIAMFSRGGRAVATVSTGRLR